MLSFPDIGGGVGDLLGTCLNAVVGALVGLPDGEEDL